MATKEILRRNVCKVGCFAIFGGLSITNMSLTSRARASQNMSFGDSVTGTISENSPIGDQNAILDGDHYEEYHFMAEGGEEIFLEMIPEIPDEDDAALVLYGPDGDRVTSDMGQRGVAGRSFIEYQLGERDGGQYTVRASVTSSNSLPNEFELRLDNGIPTDDQISFGESRINIINEGSRSGRIFSEGTSKLYEAYSFEAEGGEEIFLEMIPELPEEDQAELQLYDSDGDRVTSDMGQRGVAGRSFIKHQLGERDGGQYTVVASVSLSSDIPNEFELRLDNGIPTDNQISYGQVITDTITEDSRSGRIFTQGTSKLYEAYSFEAEGGEKITLEMFPELPEEDQAELQLFGPDGDRVTWDLRQNRDRGRSVIQQEIDEREGGQYTVVASVTGYSHIPNEFELQLNKEHQQEEDLEEEDPEEEDPEEEDLEEEDSEEEDSEEEDPEEEDPEEEKPVEDEETETEPPSADFDYVPTNPDVGEQVTFDATDSAAPTGDIVTYEWVFADGETTSGEIVSHVFDESGGYSVELSVTDDNNRSDDTSELLRVESIDEGANETDDEAPGFGVPSAIASLGGTGYLLKRRLSDTGTDTE